MFFLSIKFTFQLASKFSSIESTYDKEVTHLKTELQKTTDQHETWHRSQMSAMENRLRGEMTGLVARLEQSQAENQELEDELNGVQRRYNDLQLALQELGREQQALLQQSNRAREQRWMDDAEAKHCVKCNKEFSLTIRRVRNFQSFFIFIFIFLSLFLSITVVVVV